MLLRHASVAVALMLSLGSTVPAMAAPKSLDRSQTVAQAGPGPDNSQQRGERIFEKLNLTADQKQKMQEIRNQFTGRIAQQRQAIRQAQQELMTLMSGKASPEQLREKHRQVSTLRQQMADLQFESMLQMREVLTPEQRSQLTKLMQERRENFRGRPGQGRGPQR